MILFIAPNPHKVRDKEGFLQRVAAIDEIFANETKIYSEDISNPDKLAQIIIQADVIYIHSIYNSNKILGCYELFADKIITDLHGVVPEEEEYADNIEMTRVMSATEECVFRYGKYFVAVSEAMVEHYKNKYPNTGAKWVVLPIFHGELKENDAFEDADKDGKNVIYAGGAQRWQNVDKMVSAINSTSDRYTFTILTHSPDAFDGISVRARKSTSITTAPSREVASYYEKASLGFVLRNDNLVNNVACPTKLIEYLCYGVVPVVLHENIGDFKKLGYRYITLEEFTNKRISADRIASDANHNLEVYKTFISMAEAGKASLVKLHDMIPRDKKHGKSEVLNRLIKLQIEIQPNLNNNIRYEYQIEEYRKKVTEYAKLAEQFRLQLVRNYSRSAINDSVKKLNALKKRLDRSK